MSDSRLLVAYIEWLQREVALRKSQFPRVLERGLEINVRVPEYLRRHHEIARAADSKRLLRWRRDDSSRLWSAHLQRVRDAGLRQSLSDRDVILRSRGRLSGVTDAFRRDARGG